MTPTTPIPASLATACAAHDRHRLDVLDALLDEAAPSAVRELLGAALDLCASLRTERDELRVKLDAAPKVCAIHSYEYGPGPCMTCGAWPPGTRELIATCRTRIAGLESAANERSKEVARLTARVAELEARPVLTHEILSAAIEKARKVPPYIARQAADEYMPHLGPVTLPAQDRAEELAAQIQNEAHALNPRIYGWTWDKLDAEQRSVSVEATRRAVATLGAPPTSPPAARPVFAGVSVEELADLFVSGIPGAVADGSTRSGLRAVLARLEVSLVAPEFLRRIPLYTKHGPNGKGDPGPCDATCVKCEAERIVATLTAAGIPVTPEVGK